jgi:hypothetical protein
MIRGLILLATLAAVISGYSTYGSDFLYALAPHVFVIAAGYWLIKHLLSILSPTSTG